LVVGLGVAFCGFVEYYVYDYQGNRARTVVESDHQAQSKRDYLPSLEDVEGLLRCVVVCLV
jgi:hypothetical protein